MVKAWLVLSTAFFTTAILAQSQMPEKIVVHLYPDNLAGRKGHQVELSQLVSNGIAVTGRVTMYGNGQDGCRLQAIPIEGTFDGSKLAIGAKVEPGNTIVCPIKFELTRNTDGKFEGRFTNSQFAGAAKP